MKRMVLRLIIFYVLAIGVMLTMTPWNQTRRRGRGITGSPFVRAFASAGIPYAAGVMNLVVISAALSSANSNLLPDDADAVLAVAIGLRAGLAVIGQPTAACRSARWPLRAAGWRRRFCWRSMRPASAFLALYGTAVAGMLFIWIVILFTYLRFRAALSPQQLAALPIRMPAHRAAAWFGIVSLVAITLTTFFVDGLAIHGAVVSPVPGDHVDRLCARQDT